MSEYKLPSIVPLLQELDLLIKDENARDIAAMQINNAVAAAGQKKLPADTRYKIDAAKTHLQDAIREFRKIDDRITKDALLEEIAPIIERAYTGCDFALKHNSGNAHALLYKNLKRAFEVNKLSIKISKQSLFVRIFAAASVMKTDTAKATITRIKKQNPEY